VTVRHIMSNHHIRMISEGSCDTGVMILKNQFCITEINDILNCIKINAASVSIIVFEKSY